jgi:hypothetical protein
MKFLMLWFQSLTISETLMALISPTHFVTKVPVGHATQFLSHKLLSLVSSFDTEKRRLSSLLNTSWPATTWPRAVMVVGHSSMAT